jgi:transcriptional regulator with XRE-family HTH domain
MALVDPTGANWHRDDVAESSDEKLSPLGERIKEARLARGLSTNKANELCGFAGGYLSRVERGERESPRGNTSELIAAALGVNLQWLMTGFGARDTGHDLSGEGLQPWVEVAGRIWMARGRSRVDVLTALRAAVAATGYTTLKPLGWVDLAQDYWDGKLTAPTEPPEIQKMRLEAARFYDKRHGGGLDAAIQMAASVQGLKDPTSLKVYEGMLNLVGKQQPQLQPESADDYKDPKPTKRRVKKA